MQQEIVFSPADFVAAVNQTFEFAYPTVIIEGELANFRVSKNRWVYFDLKDEVAQVSFFGTVYSLPGPLEDGLSMRVIGAPRMHQRFGFSITFQSILPIGEGAIKKAADLLFKKLSAEGLFDDDRKRALPRLPVKIGLVTAAGSAAAADFIKILNERWAGLLVELADVYVQGELAPLQIVEAIEHFNSKSEIPEVLVITRGGGSAEDLAAFNDERVVRAVAASRIPTVVAIGHEVDISLAELAADQRASTPSNAAQLLVPDKNHQISAMRSSRSSLAQMLDMLVRSKKQHLSAHKSYIEDRIENLLSNEFERLHSKRRLMNIFDPKAALKRGYALIRNQEKFIKSVRQTKIGGQLDIVMADGTISSIVDKVKKDLDG
jgi:exodeoxyribonuclease VII large subunit